MDYEIRRPSGLTSTVVATVTPTGPFERRVMGVSAATMSFELPTMVAFRIDDFVVIAGQEYVISDQPSPRKESSIRYSYSIKFVAAWYRLARAQFLFYDNNNVLTRPDFSLMGNLETMIDLVILNANRGQSGWAKGTIDVTDYRNLTFGPTDNCLGVLSKLAEEWETEFWIDGKTIHMTKVGNSVPLTLEYGKGNGLYKIARITDESKQVITRLYAWGGEKNLPATYRNYSPRLRLPTPLVYLDRNASTYGIIEASQVFEEIYPKRIGTVTSVGDEFTVVDSGIDFDLNTPGILIDEVSVKVTFQTGLLSGYQFEIEQGSWNNAGKSFRLLLNKDEKSFSIPSPTIKPAVGDKYILSDLNMPAAYVTAAENELQSKAQIYLNQNSDPQVTYEVDPDPKFFKENAVTVELGDYVTLIDADFSLNDAIRVTGLVSDLQNPYKYTAFELTERVFINPYVRSISAQENLQAAVRINRLTDPARARLNWRNSVELRNMVFDPDGYFDTGKIKPESIETLMLSVGAKSQQFVLNGVIYNPNLLGNANSFSATAGTLDHFAIEPNIRSWTISALGSTALNVGNAYYIYARVLRTGTTGETILSTVKYKVDADPTFYYFLVGVLHTPVSGVRGISLTYGQTTINGKFITTGAIVSTDGITSFNLDNGVITGRIVFSSGSTGYNNIADKPDLSIYAETGYVDAVVQNIQDQIDGVIDSYFEQYDPTTGNAPANAWTTPELKQQHARDTFTNLDTGASWRWVDFGGGSWGWQVISDTATQQALVIAGQAQDTADHKRRVFVSTPFTPYDVGDLWTQGTGGDLMRCQTARASGSYSAGDWVKAVKYTDDAAANAAQATANAAAANAATANSLLADIASDNKLTPTEKQETKKQIDSFTAEKPQIEDAATNYGITTEKTTYTNAYNSLNSYLSSLLADLTTTSDIVGSTFRSYFATYFEKRQALLRTIADYAKYFADNAQTSANNAQSTANAAASAASTAQSTANAAASSATTANNLLADIASDNKLTPTEKQEAKKQLDSFAAEKPQIDNSADTYGISTEKSAYGTAYSALNSYLSSLLSDLTTTDNITGSTFRSYFVDYFDKRQALLNAIAARAKVLADTAQSTANGAAGSASTAIANALAAQNSINGLVIGGTNLQVDGSFELGVTGPGSGTGSAYVGTFGTVPPYIGAKYLVIEGDNTINGGDIIRYLNQSVPVIPGETYTVSFKNALGTGGALPSSSSYILLSNGTHVHMPIPFVAWDYTWKSYSQQITIPSGVTSLTLRFGFVTGQYTWLIIDALKVEKGNRATDWSPAPEDTGTAIYAAVNTLSNSLGALAFEDLVGLAKLDSTVIDGGYIKTTLIDADWIKSNVITASYIGALNADFDTATIKNLITAASGKRIAITAAQNNIRLFDASGNVIALIDDDSALESSSWNGSTVVETYGPGMSVGQYDGHSDGFSTLGRKGILTSGFLSTRGKRTVKNTSYTSSGQSMTADDHYVWVNGSGSGAWTITLPDMSSQNSGDRGRVVIVFNCRAGVLNVYPNSGANQSKYFFSGQNVFGGDASGTTPFAVAAGKTAVFVYMGAWVVFFS